MTAVETPRRRLGHAIALLDSVEANLASEADRQATLRAIGLLEQARGDLDDLEAAPADRDEADVPPAADRDEEDRPPAADSPKTDEPQVPDAGEVDATTG